VKVEAKTLESIKFGWSILAKLEKGATWFSSAARSTMKSGCQIRHLSEDRAVSFSQGISLPGHQQILGLQEVQRCQQDLV